MLEQSRYPVPGLDEGCTSCRTERGMAAAKNRADAARREIAHPLEAAVILSALTFAFALFHTFDGFEWFVGFVQSYEVIELDEILFALLLGGFATLYLAIRRTIDLRCEIRARNEAEDRATRLAHDPLTGLANRHLLVEKISSLIASDTPFALLLIDLDKFKPVNDVHGHEIGDELLIKVSERLRRLDKRLFVARLGGDEFVVLTWDHLLRSEIAGLAADIVCTLQRQFVVSQRIIAIGGTAGIALFPDDATTRQELLRAADLAMYQAKRAGRGTHAFFHPGLGRGARERAELELEVRAALSNGQIKPHFQPVIDLATNAISGFEALARWEHPKRGVIAPSDFIPIVEDLGLQDELLEVILRGAADASLTWRQDMPLAINICASQIQSRQFPIRLLSSLVHMGIEPSRVILEITERAIEGSAEDIALNFAQLRSSGIRIALDDFGKSYSNLSSLRELRFDHLKVDGSFMRSALDPNRNVLHAVIALAKELSMPARAQGVESPELADMLADLGCEHAQGFHFGGVMDSVALDEFLSRSATEAKPRAA